MIAGFLKERPLENFMLKNQPVMVSYGAYMNRLRGCGFISKQKMKRIFSSA